MSDLMGKRNWFFALSALIIVPGVASLILFGLRLGIDFTGGSLLQYKFTQQVQAGDVKQVYASAGIPDVEVQTTVDQQTAIVRAPSLDVTQIEEAENALKAKFGNVTRESADTVGPLIGQQTTRNAIIAVAAASIIILLYIWWAFRRLDKPYRYGTCAIIALLHDVLVVVGLWSIFGKVFGFQIDALFVTGVLTVVGFSVHDTVVVFDRIRENLIKRAAVTFEGTVNNSLVQTLARSLNTSLTVLFTLLALLLFGGVTIRNFVLVLLIGIASGTYSSIFNASALLVVWENWDISRRQRTRLSGAQPRRLASA
ncbi:MAG TPA: protein translocase subunit SecF [Chloroflexota bacterium]|jgi:preprotein translocase subunit SecF|nr:protein translocase subunit SecF [Chloroflexota bacterium]